MTDQRYTSVAVALHWVIAILILAQIAGGLYMHNLPNSAPEKFDLYQLHKSFGLTVLALTLVRLAWRFGHKPPALPAAMPGWQQLIARITHWAFYALLVLTPLVGWAMVSVSPLAVPTYWFGLFEVPHLAFFTGGDDPAAAEEAFKDRHEFLAFSILFLFVLHAGAALKHGFLDEDGVLRSMAPRIGAYIGVFAIFAVLALAAFSYSATGNPRAETTAAVAPEAPVEPEAPAPASALEVNAPVEEPLAADVPAEAETSPAEPTAIDETPAPKAAPPLWTVDYEKSQLRFIGEEAGSSFEGAFKDFTAEILFDPDNLEASSIVVEVKAASAESGNQFRDASMKEGEWFDSGNHPNAIFRSRTIKSIDGNAYEVEGALSIKEFSKDVTLAFTLDIDGDAAEAKGGTTLLRTDYGLGENPSWLENEQIGLTVRVEFEVAATRGE